MAAWMASQMVSGKVILACGLKPSPFTLISFITWARCEGSCSRYAYANQAPMRRPTGIERRCTTIALRKRSAARLMVAWSAP